MTFKLILRGSPTPVVAAEYLCPEHGRFEMDVERTAEGDAPDVVPCPHEVFVCELVDHACEVDGHAPCGRPAIWCISSPMTRVQKVTAAKRGKWEKPERKTWTDTSAIAEGQELYAWKEDRQRVWEEWRKADVMKFKKEHC